MVVGVLMVMMIVDAFVFAGGGGGVAQDFFCACDRMEDDTLDVVGAVKPDADPDCLDFVVFDVLLSVVELLMIFSSCFPRNGETRVSSTS